LTRFLDGDDFEAVGRHLALAVGVSPRPAALFEC
jgi:hypothetical protein